MQKPLNPAIEKPEGLQNLITLASQQLDIMKTIASKLANSLSFTQLTSIGLSNMSTIFENNQTATTTKNKPLPFLQNKISDAKPEKTEKNPKSLTSGESSSNRQLETVISNALVSANKKIEADTDDEIEDADKTPEILEKIRDLLASKKNEDNQPLNAKSEGKPSGGGLLNSLFGGKLPFKLGGIGSLTGVLSTALPLLVGGLIANYISKMDMPAVGKGLMSTIGVSSKALINVITNGSSGIKGLPTIIKSIGNVFSWVGKLLGKLPLIGNAFKGIGGVVGKVASAGSNLFKAFSGIGKTLGKAFMPILKKLPIISAAAGIFLGIGRIKKGGGLNILQGIMDIVSGIAGATGLGLVVSIPLDILNFLIDMWKSKNEANEKEGKPRQSMWQWMVSGLKNLGTALWNKIKDTSIVKGATQMVDGIKQMVSGNIISGIRTYFSSYGTMFPWIGKMFGGVMSMIDTIGDLFTSKKEDTKEEPSKSMWSTIWSGFKSLSIKVAKKLFGVLPAFIQNWFMTDSGNGEKTFDALKPVKTLGKKLFGWLNGSKTEESPESEEPKGPSLFERFSDLSKEVMLGIVNKLPAFLRKFVSVKDGKISLHFGKGLSEIGSSIKKKWKSWFTGKSSNDETDKTENDNTNQTKTNVATPTIPPKKTAKPNVATPTIPSEETAKPLNQSTSHNILSSILIALLKICAKLKPTNPAKPNTSNPVLTSTETHIPAHDVKPTAQPPSIPSKAAPKNTDELDILTKIQQTNEKVANIMLEIKTLNQLLAKTMAENTTMTSEMVGMLPALAKQQPPPQPAMPTGEYRDPINAFRTDSLFTPTRRLI